MLTFEEFINDLGTLERNGDNGDFGTYVYRSADMGDLLKSISESQHKAIQLFMERKTVRAFYQDGEYKFTYIVKAPELIELRTI